MNNIKSIFKQIKIIMPFIIESVKNNRNENIIVDMVERGEEYVSPKLERWEIHIDEDKLANFNLGNFVYVISEKLIEYENLKLKLARLNKFNDINLILIQFGEWQIIELENGISFIKYAIVSLNKR